MPSACCAKRSTSAISASRFIKETAFTVCSIDNMASDIVPAIVDQLAIMVSAAIVNTRPIPSTASATKAAESIMYPKLSLAASPTPPAASACSFNRLLTALMIGANSAAIWFAKPLATSAAPDIARCASTICCVSISDNTRPRRCAWSACSSIAAPPSRNKGIKAVASLAMASIKKVISCWDKLAFCRLST